MTSEFLMFLEIIENGKFNQLTKNFDNKKDLNDFLDTLHSKYDNYKIISIYKRVN